MIITELFDLAVAAHPDRAFLIDGKRTLTYRDVQDASLGVAAGLQAIGFGEGARGAVLSVNDSSAIVCILGLLRSGVVWLPVNPRNAICENTRALQIFKCNVLFFHSSFLELLPQILSGAPCIQSVICIDRDDTDYPRMGSWMPSQQPAYRSLPPDPDRLAAISVTSGTTGKPKGVMLTERNFVAFTLGYAQLLHEDTPPVFLAAAPITHVAGRMCFPVMHLGGTVVLLPSAEPQAILKAIQHYKITRLFLPPTAIYNLLDQPNVRAIDYSSLKYFVFGGAPMAIARLKEAIDVFGPVMTQGYGQTEAPMLIAQMYPQDYFVSGEIAPDSRLMSCGRPTAAADVAIMDEGGNVLPPGMEGEIVVRGAFVMSGYENDLAATAEVSAFGWHHTGDIGCFDADGFLFIVDRKKDMIISGGFNVYPAEIERVLLDQPGVQDCAVIGVPDAKWGEAVKAVVQPVPGHEVDPTLLQAVCRTNLGGVKTPKSIEIWSSLPRNEAGKVLKREIRRQFWVDKDRRI
ncbi:class I adenylate-forming enzyme family protein [Cupriavidus basilensis]|nr:AMP-binding protein [Cupriavidus basilensis]